MIKQHSLLERGTDEKKQDMTNYGPLWDALELSRLFGRSELADSGH